MTFRECIRGLPAGYALFGKEFGERRKGIQGEKVLSFSRSY